MQVSAGHASCAAVTETGDVWSWGTSKVIGHTESSAPPNVPTLMRPLTSKAIVQVACGSSHSVALSDFQRLSDRAQAAMTGLGSERMLVQGKGSGRAVDKKGLDRSQATG